MQFYREIEVTRSKQEAILALHVCATYLVWTYQMEGKSAIPLSEAAGRSRSTNKHLIPTTTADNGKERANHADVTEALQNRSYCKPYYLKRKQLSNPDKVA